jgi:predicted NAD/FAD-binding protein
MTSKYPKLSIAIRPSVRASLTAVATLENRPIWLIVQDGISQYIQAMTPEDRSMVEAIARRTADKHHE